MRNSLCKLQYLLCALLLFALAGCGANRNAATTNSAGDGAVAAKVQYKSTAKTVAATPATATDFWLIVTGSGIPTAKQKFPVAAAGSATIAVYPGMNLIVTAQFIDATGAILSEGFATNVIVTAGATTNVGTIMTSDLVIKAENTPCLSCHESTRDVDGQNLAINYKQSGHYFNTSPMFPKNGSTVPGCAGCHGTQHNDPNPAASGRCFECHGAVMSAGHLTIGDLQTACGRCHQPHNTKAQTSCVGCHSVPRNAGPGFVQDNNGVRSITQEFAKWSHHVTGVELNDAHCAACHLEGKVVGGAVVTDFTKHMIDSKVHLRDTTAGTDADFAWDPAAPDHSGMDTYCMSCHDANGAVSPGSAAIQAFINANALAAPGKTASAKNPFGDTISNRYDKMQRPGVIDVSTQFDVTNNSHHAVKGPRYSGRTREAGARQIASPATFAINSSALLQGVRRTLYDAGNLNQLYTPLENAAGEVAPRTGALALGDDSTLHCGDCHTVGQWKVGSSTTRLGTATPAAIGAHGSNNEYMLRNSIGTDERHTQNAFTVTAGIVTYTNPNGAFLVCYNCHSYDKYGSIFTGNGVNPTSNGVGPHAGEYDSAGRCNGVGNTLPFNGYTTGTATDGSQFTSRFDGPRTKFGATPAFAPGFPLNGTAPATGEQNPDFGNIFGIQCNNCHNSGLGNAYGGIHGSPNNTPFNDGTTVVNPDPAVTGGAYIDGLGNTTKVERFLPGLGNAMYVPGTLGGYVGGATVPVGTVVGTVTTTFEYTTGGITNDTNWEQRYGDQTLTTVIPTTGGAITGATANVGAGCYTLGGVADNQRGPSVTGEGGAATSAFGTWGGCDDHSILRGEAGERMFKRVVRPVTY